MDIHIWTMEHAWYALRKVKNAQWRKKKLEVGNAGLTHNILTMKTGCRNIGEEDRY